MPHVTRFDTSLGIAEGPFRGAKLNDEQRRALARIVEEGPIPAVHGVVRWRRKDLALWIFEEFGISLEVSSVGREPRAMGVRKMTARSVRPGASVPVSCRHAATPRPCNGIWTR